MRQLSCFCACNTVQPALMHIEFPFPTKFGKSSTELYYVQGLVTYRWRVFIFFVSSHQPLSSQQDSSCVVQYHLTLMAMLSYIKHFLSK